MHRTILLAILLLLAALPIAWSGDTKSGLQRTLTGKKIDACCCELRDGNLYCPLAKTAIETCCCK